METIIKVVLPVTRAKNVRWPLAIYRSGIGEFGGSRTNWKWSVLVFGWCVLTIHRNEYHDNSDAERAAEYLKKWSDCEKELRGLRLIVLGDETGAEVKKVIKESLGVDLDEGTVK